MDVQVLIDKLDDLVHDAKVVPLTDQVRIDKEEIYDILDQLRAILPEEIKQARWIVKEAHASRPDLVPALAAGSLEILELVDKMDDLVHRAKPVPFTSDARLDKEKTYELLDRMRATLPEEIKQARWIVKEHREILSAPEAAQASTPAEPDAVVLGALIAAHPRMVHVDDLRAELPDVAGVDEIVSRLTDDGLAQQTGDRVVATRAAVRFAELRR